MSRSLVVCLFVSLAFICKVDAKGYANVDLQSALETVKDGVNAKSKLEKEFKEKQSMLKKREEEIRKMTADYQKKQLVMSEEKRAQEEQTIQKKMMEYKDIMQQSQVQMQKREIELTKPIIDSIRSIIGEIAEKQEYELVYEKNQSGIFYTREPKDITSEVIEKYNASSTGTERKPRKGKNKA